MTSQIGNENDAAVSPGAAGNVNQKLRLLTSQHDTANTNLSTIITALSTLNTNLATLSGVDTTTTATVAISGTDTPFISIPAGCEIMLFVPALDSTTLTFNVLSGSASGSVFKDGDGFAVLSIPASTGSFALGSSTLYELKGAQQVQIHCGSAQNTLARTFTWAFRKG